MELIILTKEQYDEILKRLNELKDEIVQLQKGTFRHVIDNQDFIQLLKISKRTAQTWRDEGIITFSQVGGKIYYKFSDIEKLIDRNSHEAFKIKKRFY